MSHARNDPLARSELGPVPFGSESVTGFEPPTRAPSLDDCCTRAERFEVTLGARVEKPTFFSATEVVVVNERIAHGTLELRAIAPQRVRRMERLERWSLHVEGAP